MKLNLNELDLDFTHITRKSSNPRTSASFAINPRRADKTECWDDTNAYRRKKQKYSSKPKSESKCNY